MSTRNRRAVIPSKGGWARGARDLESRERSGPDRGKRVRRALGATLVLLLLASCTTTRSVTIVHVSDYHSHAVPFYANGEPGSAGIARAIAWIEPLARRDDVLVLSGGDTINRGAPAWSDKYGCVEWSWWNGIVDAMAWGNHDADYGTAAFLECAKAITYPILSANIAAANGEPLFLVDGKPYVVFERNGVKIGVFAVVGSDFEALVRPERMPAPGARFTPRIEAARAVVRALRETERVDAVVLIGHESAEDDEALARAVPGIDLILGTHSHRLEPLRRIEGTSVRTIAPGQYLEAVSRVELRFRGRALVEVDGALTPMSARLREDPGIAARVKRLQNDLEADPAYRDLFVTIGTLDRPLSVDGVFDGNSELGRFVMDRVREVARADLALSTSSSFRQSIAAGAVQETELRVAMPYDNAILRCTMTGGDVLALLEHVVSLRGTDSFAQLSGASVEVGITVGGAAIDPARSYAIATTDYAVKVSPLYRDLFSRASCEDTGERVRDVARNAIGSR